MPNVTMFVPVALHLHVPVCALLAPLPHVTDPTLAALHLHLHPYLICDVLLRAGDRPATMTAATVTTGANPATATDEHMTVAPTMQYVFATPPCLRAPRFTPNPHPTPIPLLSFLAGCLFFAAAPAAYTRNSVTGIFVARSDVVHA